MIRDRSLLALTTAELISQLGSSFSGLALPWFVLVTTGSATRMGIVFAVELVPFAAITEADVRRAGEPDRESLRRRAAHAGPIDDDTLVYRIELHAVSLED